MKGGKDRLPAAPLMLLTPVPSIRSRQKLCGTTPFTWLLGTRSQAAESSAAPFLSSWHEKQEAALPCCSLFSSPVNQEPSAGMLLSPACFPLPLPPLPTPLQVGWCGQQQNWLRKANLSPAQGCTGWGLGQGEASRELRLGRLSLG